MSIRVVCECGSRLDAPDELAGQQARCGACGAVLTIAPARKAREASAVDGVRLPPKLTGKKKKKVFTEHNAPLQEEETRTGKRKKKKKSAEEMSAGPRKRRSLAQVWVDGLTFPFRREALITTAVLAFLYGPIMLAMSFGPAMLVTGFYAIKFFIGFFTVSILIVGYFCYFLFQTLRCTAQNERELPVATAFDFEEVRLDLWLMIGGTGMVFLPLIVTSIAFWWDGRSTPDALYYPLLAFCLFLWPMGVIASVLQTSVLAANHWTTLTTILKLPFQYTATLIVAGGLVAVAIGLDWVVPRLSFKFGIVALLAGIIRGFLTWWLVFLTVTACMSLMGYLYYRNRNRIGWFRDSQPRY
ncbi:hypothetical protein Pan44_29350 [Caulifigura coniformis]|uniref:Uncharacterized protein n=1 Tax=Caulifigura coniformis TaxID=2527983 RepID=A0A517SFJ1_9PLAN|nr:hypothetical protein [Caulifigura coniformis]QDT54896.1 hypothetical protein Pan44_29350 [Caulifigura coniformis]